MLSVVHFSGRGILFPALLVDLCRAEITAHGADVRIIPARFLSHQASFFRIHG